MDISPAFSARTGLLAISGIALVVIGSLGIAGIVGIQAVGWIVFGITLPSNLVLLTTRDNAVLGTILGLALPVIGALSAFGYVPLIAVCVAAIVDGGLKIIFADCLHHTERRLNDTLNAQAFRIS